MRSSTSSTSYARAGMRADELVMIKANQGVRPARVLAVLSNVALVEYTLPSHLTALAFASTKRSLFKKNPLELKRLPVRPCSYRTLGKEWLEAVIAQHKTWKGNSYKGQMPSPQEVLDEHECANKGTHVAKGWRSVRGDPMDYQWKMIDGRRCVIAHVAVGAPNDPVPANNRSVRKETRWRMLLFIDGRCVYYMGNAKHFSEWIGLAADAHHYADVPSKMLSTHYGITGYKCPVPARGKKRFGYITKNRAALVKAGARFATWKDLEKI